MATATLYKLKILKPVYVHTRSTLASTKNPVMLQGGSTVVASKKEGTMYYVDSQSGWVDASDKTKVELVPLMTKDETPKTSILIKPSLASYSTTLNNLIAGKVSLSDIVESSLEQMLKDQLSSEATFDASMRLFGQPFQFNPTTDPYISKTLHLGRKYVETYIAEAPIVYIMPGKASYLPELKEDEKSVVTKMLDGINEISNSVKEDIFNAEQRLFDFVPDYSTYMNYVNVLCRVGATLMGLGDRKSPTYEKSTDTYRFYDWANYKYENAFSVEKNKKNEVFTLAGTIKEAAKSLTESFKSWYEGFQYVQFYVDPSSSFQESGSNNSGTSAIQSYLEKAQGAVKEFSFMSTAASSATGIPDAVAGIKGVVDSAIGAFSGGVFNKVLTNSQVIIDGGNMLFPEIWGDSNYNKSYNVSMNLISPYGDKESIYLHVLVPLFHLVALTIPRQLSANGYGQPFLVKVSSKGWFNCELGMVESISIEKVMGSYSVNGLPTEIRVDLSIKDLYSNMMISSSQKPGDFFENKGLMNWLAITCGLDITKPAIAEKWVNVLTTLIGGSVIDIPGNLFEKVKEATRNTARSIINF